MYKMDTFEIDVYTISTSLNERTIYLKIIDTIQYLHYEGNIELKEFRMPITLQDAYILVKNCFSEAKDHSVSFSKNTNVLRLDFKAKVGGYMNIGFEFILRESAIEKGTIQMIEMDRKHKKEIGDIMARLDRMEHHYDSKIESLEAIIEKQGNMIEIFGNLKLPGHLPLNSIDVYIDDSEVIYNFQLYYKCKKATIVGRSSESLKMYKNNNIEEINISKPFTSLDGLQNMPNLKIININFTSSTGNYLIDFVKVLSSYTHTIRQIIIHQHQSKPDPTELQTYCKKNNIDLIVQ